MRVWALEPFYGGSHKQFLDGLVRHSIHDFTLLTLPGRFWKWRMQGGALALAGQAEAALEKSAEPYSDIACPSTPVGGLPDVFFASDMLDLPVFLATLGRGAARVPTIVYFHENQLTYPLPPGVERDLGYGFKNLTTALAAQTVLFNSEYHRREFLDAARDLMLAMPDAVPEWAVERIAARSSILGLGCDLRALDAHRARGLEQAATGRWGDPAAGPLIVWNQRWEYDKAPEELFRGLETLWRRGVPFRLAVAGSGTAAPGEEFEQAREVLTDRVVQWGRLDNFADYAGLLWAADVVVSTAIHEFFGVAVIEAVYCGCRPVLPRRLSYPEIIPAEAHEDVLYGEGEFVDALAGALEAPHAISADWLRASLARFDWGSLRTRYDGIIRMSAARGIAGPRG